MDLYDKTGNSTQNHIPESSIVLVNC